jgi:5'-deoxynucleotidase YfbR-like HD superfamily hydrolase
MKTSEINPRAWIRLPSGQRLDLINPSSEAWLDSDLAIRLSRTYRWGGESVWPQPLSVAQHSLTVLALRREWSNVSLSPTEALHELLHDAEEGFLGFDCISPLKGVLGQPFKAVSDRLMSTICTRYDLPEWRPDIYLMHKRADLIAASSEAVHCVGWKHQEVREVLGITHPILAIDPLAKIYDCAPWMPWSSDLAAERFLSELSCLIKQTNRDDTHQYSDFVSNIPYARSKENDSVCS